MKNYLSLVLAATFLWTTTLNAAVEVGAQAPDFTLTDTTGKQHRLSDFTGQYVVLEWTNRHCPFVMKHYGEGDMQALQESMTADGVVWLQVISSAEGKQGYVTPAEGEVLRESQGMHSTAMLLDTSGSVGRQYDARTTPHMYLINPEGTLVYQGAIDSIKSARQSDIAKAKNYVKAAYESAKAGEPVEDATTVPYGCSVKY
ncbi:thioredoxin family protein [Coraliomargarita sp. SDUM461004]|uniref:Thioredoxin family protein n=1 Tax=Thalassobacterium sedimentorum TaxID=3041258 RepID=A0ABU1AGS0_9BACT|nr:thioredoxin family protein [Coraliomargarita sp. SDUM461004]MDQ8193981.1 thioredoxin family protein [Coraliomargarita sp. SDUM461004]